MKIVLLVIAAGLLSFFVYWPKVPFKLGLDLLGGAHLVYEANLHEVPSADRESAMEGVRDVIERRVNLFGAAEPSVQVSGGDRLIVELPQVKEVGQAIRLIGETPFLEFKELPIEIDLSKEVSADKFIPTGLSGKQLKRAYLSFDPNTNLPHVSLEYNDEGSRLLSDVSKRNIGRPMAIFLDGLAISIPIVQDEISDGQAVISGTFTINEARELAQRLSAGALPVPISLVSQQVVGPTLGLESLEKSLKAGLYGLLALIVFMVFFYRGFGLVSVFSLLFYAVSVLAVFKLLPVTLTLAGIAGFILTLGMAVDGNILIFSRIKEELKEGKNRKAALDAGFARAWSSIRDSQVTTLIAAAVLYVFATSLVKGFALTLAIGTIFSIFSSVYVTKTFLKTAYK